LVKRQDESVIGILKAAFESVLDRGYSKSGVREIAERAGVSLGLINHYFGSKQALAAEMLGILWEYVSEEEKRFLDMKEDPLLYEAVSIRTLNTYLLQSRLRQFYVDCLQEDVFFAGLSVLPDEALALRMKKYNYFDPMDVVQLYNRYIPYTVEKTLVLKKEEGLFPSIGYEDIPKYICLSSMNRYIPEDLILEADARSREITAAIIPRLREIPPERVIRRYVETLRGKQ